MTTIIPLADRPDAIPQLARWFFAEWGALDQRPVEQIAQQLRGNLNRNAVPMTWLAVDGERVIGSISLDLEDLPGFNHLTPWLACFYVDRTHRGHGTGRALLAHLLAEAQRLRIASIYLWTSNLEDFYVRQGWRRVDETNLSGQRVVVMRRDFPPG